jgi:hypothetical protein
MTHDLVPVPRQKVRTSDIVRHIIAQCEEGGSITLREFLHLLGDRSFGLVILMFSLPNSLPIPGIPGFSTVTGLPITLIALQMVLGRQTVWLPEKMANISFSKTLLGKMLSKALPSLIKLEKILKPRVLAVTSPLGERVIGAFFVVLSLIIALPIPGGNFLPGVAMSLIGLGLLERDGLFILLSKLFAIGSIIFMCQIIVLFFEAVHEGLAGLF